MNRRDFLKLCGALIASTGISIPAFAQQRKPYVVEGDVVDFIGHCDTGGNQFTGGKLVYKVFEWDGVGYPVVLNKDWQTRPSPTYYDFELSNFLKDVPKHFWHNPENVKKYNNVHTYVREQRFGETVEQAVKHLNFVSSRI